MMIANFSYIRDNFKRGSHVNGYIGQYGAKGSNTSKGMFCGSYPRGFPTGSGNSGRIGWGGQFVDLVGVKSGHYTEELIWQTCFLVLDLKLCSLVNLKNLFLFVKYAINEDIQLMPADTYMVMQIYL